jgi:hypothetical protein
MKDITIKDDHFVLQLTMLGDPCNWPHRDELMIAIEGMLCAHGYVGIQEELCEMEDTIMSMRRELDGREDPLTKYGSNTDLFHPFPGIYTSDRTGTGAPVQKSNGTISNGKSSS